MPVPPVAVVPLDEQAVNAAADNDPTATVSISVWTGRLPDMEEVSTGIAGDPPERSFRGALLGFLSTVSGNTDTPDATLGGFCEAPDG